MHETPQGAAPYEAASQAASATSHTVVFRAKRIHTFDGGTTDAGPTDADANDAIAVRGGRVLQVGRFEELSTHGAKVDTTFADHVILPGFVEGHAHVMSGAVWQFPYVGFFDRRDPSGKLWPGCRSFSAIVERLTDASRAMETTGNPDQLLFAWGLDPIYFPGVRFLGRELDQVSTTRPIFVLHASSHLATVNQAMLRASGITADSTHPGVARDEAGEPNGELQESAMSLARGPWLAFAAAIGSDRAKELFAAEARNAGHTFITDLGTSRLADPENLDAWRRIVNSPAYPTRVMVAMANTFGGPADPAHMANLAVELRQQCSDKLHFGIVKLVLDGSIQGFTARLEAPFYHHPPVGHHGNGHWLIPPEQLTEMLALYDRAGLSVHVHCNGDQAIEVFLDAVEDVQRRQPRSGQRHTAQHAQMSTVRQLQRMRDLGVNVNLFSNHLWYWGDQHRDVSIGPERAARINPAANALRHGVSLAIHSDAPVTPMGHLHVAWCAVNRMTSTGQILGPEERITVAQALHASTMGPAYQMGVDHLVGSLTAGKFADFAVLEADPFETDPAALRDIKVWGTVLGGVAQPSTVA
jgi:predicted amidohydrolase YtcJ